MKNAYKKTPKPFEDYSNTMMNVPGSISKLPASGVDFMPYGGHVDKLERAGKMAGKKLTKLSKKKIRGRY